MALNGDLPGLREHDQLLLARRDKSHALAEYEEAELAFEPTYKYDVGTPIFDTSEKRRAPAWCDRVLWRAQADDPKAGPSGQSLSRITPTWYGRHELTTSDHRPIGAALTVAVAVAVAERRRAVQSEILRSP